MPERVHFQRSFDSYQRTMLRVAVAMGAISCFGWGAIMYSAAGAWIWGPIPEQAVQGTAIFLMTVMPVGFFLGPRILIRLRYGFCLFEDNELVFVPTFTTRRIVVKRRDVKDYRQLRHGVLVRVRGRNPLFELTCPLLIPVEKEWDGVAALVLLNREGRFG